MNLNHELIELTRNAALTVYWHKKSFHRFLSDCGISNVMLSSWPSGQTKRDFLERVIEVCKKQESGQKIIYSMAKTLSEKEVFPDLQSREDSEYHIKKAKDAVKNLSDYISKIKKKEEKEKNELNNREEKFLNEKLEEKRLKNLETMESQLMSLHGKIGDQSAGYEFENWFYELMSLAEIEHRRPYKTNGRQIDGSITINGTTYLVELKFQRDQADATDIDSIIAKINSKADNTMGIMLSMAGYSKVAIAEASRPKTPLLLFDVSHLQIIFRDVMSFSLLIERLRRHASQTGEAYLSSTTLYH